MKTRLVVDGLDSLDPTLEDSLYRIAQEALNNTLKHAAATSVEVHLSLAGEYLILEVKDNGQGFNPDQASGKGGLGPPHIGAALICTHI